MQSIASIIQNVQSDLRSLTTNEMDSALEQLDLLNKSQATAQAQKINLMDQKASTVGKTANLKIKSLMYSADGLISRIKTRVMGYFKNLKEEAVQGNQDKCKTTRMLQVMGEANTNTLNNDASAYAAAPSNSVDQKAVTAAIEGKHMAKNASVKAQEQNLDKESRHIDNAKNAIKSQIKALKKHKFFKTLFKFVMPVISALTQWATGFIASPIVAGLVKKCTDALMSLIESSVLNGFAKKANKAQDIQTNADQNLSNLQEQNQNSVALNQEGENIFNQAAQKLETANL